MKWKNKGHEFDDVYENLRQKKKFYLFGAGRDGKLVLGVIRKLFGDRIEIAGYWDNDPQKDGTTYEGLPVTLPRACADIRGGVSASFSALGSQAPTRSSSSSRPSGGRITLISATTTYSSASLRRIRNRSSISRPSAFCRRRTVI